MLNMILDIYNGYVDIVVLEIKFLFINMVDKVGEC